MNEKIRVLLIDDETIFAESLTKVLSRRGMAVRCAHDGESGLECLGAEECDVIVLDFKMPGMDGLETLKAIRDNDPLTPVLLLSGNIDVKQVAQALKDGATEVLLKPCPIDALVSCIEDAFERKVCAADVAEKT